MSRIRGTSSDQKDASWSPVHVRGADSGERAGFEGRLGLQQRWLRRSGVCPQSKSGTTAGYVVQRSLQRQDTLRRRDTRVHTRVRLARRINRATRSNLEFSL